MVRFSIGRGRPVEDQRCPVAVGEGFELPVIGAYPGVDAVDRGELGVDGEEPAVGRGQRPSAADAAGTVCLLAIAEPWSAMTCPAN